MSYVVSTGSASLKVSTTGKQIIRVEETSVLRGLSMKWNEGG